MKMNKASKMAMMYGLFATMGNDAYGHAINEMTDEGIRPKKTKQKKQVKKIIPKGLTKFFYGEKVIYALNKKNADRKALKQGLTI
jgi:Na+-translocating ferredoxin:NAD+ oxidoreductase RnfG subunit